MKKLLFALCLLASTAVSVLAESYNFRHYQVENGLSYNSVLSSLQDKKGFLWFGTKDGLNRFDGYNFKIFRKDADNPKSIGNNYIHALCEDQEQRLWVGTLRGLYKYDPIKEDFKLIANTKNQDVRDVEVDRFGNIWYIAGTTLYKYNEKSNALINFSQLKHPQVTAITISQNDLIWLSTTDGYIQKYDLKTKTFQSFNVFDHSEPAISNWVEKIYDTGKGLLLIGTSNQGIKSFNTKTCTYQDILTRNAADIPIYARDFMAKGGDEYWIATESGLLVYDIKTGLKNTLRHQLHDPYSISDNSVYTLTKDREGGVWAGTYFGGVNYYPHEFVHFDKYFPEGSENSISGYAVREICKDKLGNLWIGTEDAGLNKLNLTTGRFEHLLPNGEKSSISHSNIHGLVAAGNELWVGTFEQGLDVLDIRTSKVIRHYRAGLAANALKSNFIETLLQTKDGNILVGTSTGLYRYNKDSDDFTLVHQVPGNIHYSCLLEDRQGTIWAGTLKEGLYYFNPREGSSGYFRNEESNKNSLISNDVNGLFMDAAQNIWITTEYGLCRLNQQKKGFIRYDGKNGFANVVTYQILQDKSSNLWISTSSGLFCFDPHLKTSQRYTKANGLLGNQFNYKSSFQDDQGKMYFGSVNGLIRFDPSAIRQNKFNPAVYITGFQVFNQELSLHQPNSPLVKSINFTREISLPHDQSTFSIDFAALGYTAPEMTAYKYILEGLEKDWTSLKRNRKVYFTNVPAGTYIFKLKASNVSGVWNNRETTLIINIEPPFWASTAALCTYVLIGILLIISTVRYYHQTISRKSRRKAEIWESTKEKELYEAKIEFFTNITHEIRTPLTLISGPLEELISKSGKAKGIDNNLNIMKKNTARLIELTDQLLDFRKSEESGFQLNFVYVNISKLLEEICFRYSSAARSKHLDLTLKLPQEPLYAYADLEALHKILGNLIDNAFKYAEHLICINLIQIDGRFSVEVRSDGLIIPVHLKQKIFEPFYRMPDSNHKKGTGIGLALARALAELHQGTLVLEYSDSSCNSFVLNLPMQHERQFKISNFVIEGNVEDNINPNNNPDAPTILLVEDDVEMRQFIARQLVQDFTVIQANNGQQAVEIINNTCIHLIISDLMMPVMDGLEFCKVIKSSTENAHIPFILLTAINTLTSKIEGLEVGADAYIEKPFSPVHLLTQVSNLLNSRSIIKNHFANSPLVHIRSMAYNKADEAFLEKVNEFIVKNILNKPNVNQLAELMNMSRPTFYRKIKSISNLTPHELINITRLKKAAELLVQENYSIQQIASMTGFGSQAHFSKSFLKQFGMSPSEYTISVKMKNETIDLDH